MHKHKLLEDLKINPKNIRFEKLCRIAEAFVFHSKVEKEAIEFIYERT